jgi:carbon storage regulator
MLVVTRKPGERIVIPDCDLTITVLECTRGQVRLGMSAPPGVGIYREELWRKLGELSSGNNRVAAAT